MKYTELKKHVAENGILPIYLFEGEEEYFREKGKQTIKNTVSEPEFNYTLFDKKAGLKSLVDAIYTLPFLSDKRMVVAEEFYPTEKEYETFLKPLFENPVDTTVFVIVNSGKSKTGVDFKKKPNVNFVDCSRAEEETVTKWIYLTLKNAGITADGAVCNAVQRYCVCNMARVEKEVEKLKEYAGAVGTVTMADVDALVYKDSEYKIYELTQAAGRGDYNGFMQIMDGMIGKGFDETGVLNALCSYFRTLAEVSSFKGSAAQAAEALGMKEYAVKKSREQAARFKNAGAQEYYSDAYKALAAIRAGEITPSAALKMIIAKIFFKKR